MKKILAISISEGKRRRMNLRCSRRRGDSSAFSLLSVSLSVSVAVVMIDGWNTLPVNAVESPNPTRKNRGQSPSLGSGYESHNQSDVIEVVTGRINETMNSVDSNEDAHDAKEEEVSKLSSHANRKHRQQSRQTQRLTQPENGNPSTRTHADYDAYMHWCQKVLGIRSVVKIQEFEYVDHLQIYWDENTVSKHESEDFDWLHQYSDLTKNDSYHAYDQHEIDESAKLPTRLVRGLAAQQDIQHGELVISIPLYSLLSVPTTIDHDPVLSRILGPDARNTYGWTDPADYELTLLALALLYHRSLGNDSPISHYIDMLLETPTDSFPFLWSDQELREKAEDGEVKKLARGIRQHMHDMYDQVMRTLVKESADTFAPPHGFSRTHLDSVSHEWAYSYEKFKWAFALVVSRHHYLPIYDFDDDHSTTPKRPIVDNSGAHTISTVTEVLPPANQPVSSWVDEAHNEERVVDDKVIADDDQTGHLLHTKHSFLAPLADLINFGPPCLTGRYNEEEHTFELIAMCSFSQGQEVTFWYSSDCAASIIADYGFLHPLVPPCTAPENWETLNGEWREKIKVREKKLWEMYRKVDKLEDELSVLERKLIDCGCEDEDKKQVYSMPTASGAEAKKLRKDSHHHSLRQDIGVRGRINEVDEQELTIQQAMEELG